jgi:hypothetical protein
MHDRRTIFRSRIAALAFVLAAHSGLAGAVEKVDFNREIRPLLSDKCFKCHGFDPKNREADVRLDVSEGAYAKRDDGSAVIVPGKSADSLVYHRIASDDPDAKMPPPGSGKELNAEQVALIKRWIDEGAEYKPHWSFVAPQRPKLPVVQNAAWPAAAIDRFILAKLEQAKLTPAEAADRYQLIRRLSLDLTGIPPTPEAAVAFAADPAPDAYEKLVDRLLASSHYGERWALWWLDLARYADTNGYEVDRPRSIWPYRDWVIHAMNDNMPFDQFAIEQLAGDLLPNATLAQKVATGFHRNTFFNEEGGHDYEQFRWEAIVDRVHTTSTVFLGLTTACAQCHDHKFDPISHREYYEFFAFLNNCDEPQLQVPQPEIVAERARILAEIAKSEAKLAEKFPSDNDDPKSRQQALAEKFEAWRKETAGSARRWVVLEPTKWTAKNGTTLSKLDDNSILGTGDRPETECYDVVYRAPLKKITGIKLEAIPDPRLPYGGPGRGYYGQDGTFLLSELTATVRPLDADSDPHSAKLTRPSASFGAKSVSEALDGKKLTGWKIKDGIGRRVVATFEFAKPIEFDTGAELSLKFLQNFVHSQTLGRFYIWATGDDGRLKASDMPNEVERILLKHADDWTAAEREQAMQYYLSIAPELADEHKKIEALRKSLPAIPTTLVLEERQDRRPSHKHGRGDFKRKEEEVSPGVPSFLPPLPKDAPRNRLTMARWLVDRKNPLVARVVMNQVWQNYFGRGLVSTPEDFGTQGDPPSHPELLDWLACEFMDSGWDLKHMHRLIVTSAAYRQSSAASPEKLEHDPENVLVSRGPRFRLHSETIRDIVLSASGMLTDKLGGPSVFPPQPEGVAEASAIQAPTWVTSTGPDRYRRGLYTHRKRGAPYAAFAAFDAPAQNVCSMKRIRSNTPLASLTLLNDGVIIEAAQTLAARALKMSGDDEVRLRYAFQLCVTRPPTDAEVATLSEYLKHQRERFERNDSDAPTVAGLSKEESADAKLAADRAAWTMLARVLLNLDETICKE